MKFRLKIKIIRKGYIFICFKQYNLFICFKLYNISNNQVHII
jgi:hypothetical protein